MSTALMEGYLEKWTNLIQGWKSRYFILHKDLLIYCNEKGAPQKGIIYLKIAQINADPDDPLRIIVHTGTNEIHIRAKDIAEKIRWIKAMQTV